MGGRGVCTVMKCHAYMFTISWYQSLNDLNSYYIFLWYKQIPIWIDMICSKSPTMVKHQPIYHTLTIESMNN